MALHNFKKKRDVLSFLFFYYDCVSQSIILGVLSKPSLWSSMCVKYVNRMRVK